MTGSNQLRWSIRGGRGKLHRSARRKPLGEYEFVGRFGAGGDRAARHIRERQRDPIHVSRVPHWIYQGDTEPAPALIEGDMTTIRNIMWHYVELSVQRNGWRGQTASFAICSMRKIVTFYR